MNNKDRMIFQCESGSNITLEPDCFAVFIDETGHEELCDSNYPIFGLGGCGVMVEHYNRLIRSPWYKMKKEHFGGEDVPLHACELYGASKEQLSAISNFFCRHQFSRVAALVSDKSLLVEGVTPYHITAASLLTRIEHVAKWFDRKSVALIFEDSTRGNNLILSYFDQFNKFKLTRDGEVFHLPIHKYFMIKSSVEPGLEVADFVMNAAGGNVRAYLKSNAKPNRKDFNSVFRDVDEKLVSYFEIQKVINCNAA